MLKYLPILVGFVIGLVTNFIAILMMFRPHKKRPWLFFWSQGLVPKEREALAQSVGEAVGNELLSPEQLEHLVTGPEGRQRTREMLDRLLEATTEKLAQRPLAELLGTVAWNDWAENIRSYLSQSERKQELHAWLVVLIKDRILELATQSVEEVMGSESLTEVEKLMASRLTKSKIAQKADTFVQKSKYIFTPSTIVSWLFKDENRTAVEKAADDLARFLIDSLRERKVDNLLGFEAQAEADKIADEAATRILEHFSSPENVHKFVDALRKQLAPFLQETPIMLSEKVDPVLIESIREHLEEIVHNLLRDNTAAVVRAMNLSGIVEERVCAYPISDLEKLVLEISGKHLKWITLWGGILGALLGALQLVLPR